MSIDESEHERLLERLGEVTEAEQRLLGDRDTLRREIERLTIENFHLKQALGAYRKEAK